MTISNLSNDYSKRFEVCRRADGQKDDLINELLADYKSLSLAHQEVLGDFEDAKKSRRYWQNEFDRSQGDFATLKQDFEVAKRQAVSFSVESSSGC